MAFSLEVFIKFNRGFLVKILAFSEAINFCFVSPVNLIAIKITQNRIKKQAID